MTRCFSVPASLTDRRHVGAAEARFSRLRIANVRHRRVCQETDGAAGMQPILRSEEFWRAPTWEHLGISELTAG